MGHFYVNFLWTADTKIVALHQHEGKGVNAFLFMDQPLQPLSVPATFSLFTKQQLRGKLIQHWTSF
ncbi:hypothetical protein AWJ07_17775 [Shewanella frigidimarina]|uniref:Uncharacterized protein n=1 Tax=Shewanella frigidimarina TaxID=56812 RepID=A0A119CZH5_SHEFR|nr:hypothetical protein AWJ07_17775 [Shewanella frigidimarina]